MKKLLILIALFSCTYLSFTFASTIDDAISWMYSNGLTIHNNQKDFNTTRGLRRDEAAKFFVNFSKLLNKTNYVKTDNQCKFFDINDSRSDLKDIVTESCKLGLFQGSNGYFYPKKEISNAQAVAVLIRLLTGSQIETGLNHRSDNYYSKANELNMLQNVSMNNKNDIATRGNVGISIYNGNNIKINSAEKDIRQKTDKYIIKTEKGNKIPGENIYIFDLSGNEIFSLIANNNPSLQFFIKIVGNYLVVDYGTSAGIRDMSVYNIITKENIFTTNYDSMGGKGLIIDGSQINIYVQVYSPYTSREIEQPKELPKCASDRGKDSIGYSELRIFHLDNKKLEKTGKIVCSFVE